MFGVIYSPQYVLNVPLTLYGTQYIIPTWSKYSVDIYFMFDLVRACASQANANANTWMVGTCTERLINKDEALLAYWHATAVLPGAVVICMEAWQGHSIKSRPPVPLMDVSLPGTYTALDEAGSSMFRI